jgi:feruloyl esterase
MKRFVSRSEGARLRRIAIASCLAAAVCIAPAGARAAASPNCSVSALTGAVPGITVASAVDVPASAANPEFCDVRGALATAGEGAPAGAANFELQLPVAWNQKFLFWGVGGLAGSTYADFAANPVDYYEALFKGYATAITDEGHQAGNTDASWALNAQGTADLAAVADYYDRSTHEVTAAAKQLVLFFYGASAIEHAYFDGCSNGGRQAMVEATHFPDDYDGIIAGAPFMDIRTIIAGVKFQKNNLASAQSYIPASLLPIIDAAVYASCDAADGVQDGLIQNPARCSFEPKSLICKNGATSNCLTPGQANTLRSYISALRDPQGEVIYNGASITDLTGGMDVWSVGEVPPTDFSANEPWGGTGFGPAPVAWQFVDHIMKFLVERDPTYDIRSFGVTAGGVVNDRALAFFDSRTVRGDGAEPHRLHDFIRRDGKLLMFHGFSDPALPPFRTISFYKDLARIHGGFERVQHNVRLFMVPGMQHCGGGPGPNFFDTLTALENWREKGVGPDAIVAAHYTNNDATLPVDRTMPLCKFPEEAQYSGSGSYNDGANWSCTDNRKLLEIGSDGASAGL